MECPGLGVPSLVSTNARKDCSDNEVESAISEHVARVDSAQLGSVSEIPE